MIMTRSVNGVFFYWWYHLAESQESAYANVIKSLKKENVEILEN